jgi:hypothetical protein
MKAPRLPKLFDITDEGSAIANAIRDGRCVSVSDGSFKDQYGTSVWAIEAESSVDRCTGADIPAAAACKNNRCMGVNIVPGAPSDQSAYRSELVGLYAFLDRWATLSIEVDEDAKVHWAETVGKPHERQFTISGEPWAIWLKNKNICMNLHSTLRSATRGQASWDYWGKTWKMWARHLL